jgi:hypothetical protein
MLQSIFEFQPQKRIPGWIYHVLSVSAGLVYVIFAVSYDDLGKGVLLACSVIDGSFI